MSDPTQTQLYDPSPEPDAPGAYQANVNAHIPPQVAEAVAWIENPHPWWNPDTNEWAPSNVPHHVGGPGAPQQPSHGDVMTAEPMINMPGWSNTYDEGGGTPDVRLNLLNSIRSKGKGTQAPVMSTVHHIVETNEIPSGLVRLTLYAVVGNNAPVTILNENEHRDRALVSIFTAASTILLYPTRAGGVPQLTAAPVQPGAFWPMNTADGNLEFKSSAGVDCVGISASGLVLVRVLEELRGGAGFVPGLS